jgi:hypothetical protein
VGFAAEPELARVMLQRALDAGVPAGWATADEADGGSPALRGWLETRQLPYVLAVKRTEPLPSASGPLAPAAWLAEAVAVELLRTLEVFDAMTIALTVKLMILSTSLRRSGHCFDESCARSVTAAERPTPQSGRAAGSARRTTPALR